MADSKLFDRRGPVKLSGSDKEKSEGIEKDSLESAFSHIKPPETQKSDLNTEFRESSIPRSQITEQPETAKSMSMGQFVSSLSSGSTSMGQKTDSFDYMKQSHSSSPLEANISTSWSPTRTSPIVDRGSFVHSRGLVIGAVLIKSGVFVGPFAVIRGDEEELIYISENSAILEGAILNGLPTRKDGQKLTQRLIQVGQSEYPIFISQKVTVSQGVKIHGPAYVGSNTYLGMGSLIFWAKIGSNCVIEPGGLIINVDIPDGRFVPAGVSVTSQKMVQGLPVITSRYRFAGINDEMLQENAEILKGYLERAGRY